MERAAISPFLWRLTLRPEIMGGFFEEALWEEVLVTVTVLAMATDGAVGVVRFMAVWAWVPGTAFAVWAFHGGLVSVTGPEWAFGFDLVGQEAEDAREFEGGREIGLAGEARAFRAVEDQEESTFGVGVLPDIGTEVVVFTWAEHRERRGGGGGGWREGGDGVPSLARYARGPGRVGRPRIGRGGIWRGNL